MSARKTTEPVSKLPALLERLGIDERMFISQCYAWGIGIDTAKKLYKGQANMKTSTLKILAEMLNVEMGDIVE